MSLEEFWKEAARITQALWYTDERNCVFCGDKQGPICLACTANYLHPDLGRCRGCGKLIRQEKIFCLDCEAGRGPKQLDKVTAWGHYTGGLKEFIHTMKFNAHPRCFRKIAGPFAEWVIRQLPVVDGIVAVPMHSERLVERGFNQAEVIASALHWELGLKIFPEVERIKPTMSQVTLARQERLHNLKGAFAVRNPEKLKGLSLWLVDDVTTTGATLEAVAEVLRESEVHAIYGLCLAAGLE